jgi:Ca-activated chloride channel family protein
MRFASPQALWLLALLPLLALAGWWGHRMRRRAMARFAGGTAYVARFVDEVSPHRRAIKVLLLYVALASLPLVLARPQWGTRLEQITRRGADIAIVLDTSRSMSAEDVPPTRLGQAQHLIASLVDRLGGDRLALVTFAGRAVVHCPLTVDHGALRLMLEALDVESVPVPGTALAAGLASALAVLEVEEGASDERGRAIVLLSDGEDYGGELDAALERLAASGVAVYAVGCGTTRGAPIPLRDEAGMLAGYKKDRQERVVTTRLSEAVLERIALESGGRYYRATASEVEVEEIAQALTALSQGELGSELRTRYEERFQLPLLVGWLALTAETVLGDRRRRRSVPQQGGDVR